MQTIKEEEETESPKKQNSRTKSSDQVYIEPKIKDKDNNRTDKYKIESDDQKAKRKYFFEFIYT